MVCEACGTTLSIGMWPLCRGNPARHQTWITGRGADVTWPGGKTFENLGHEPQTFYSPAELRRYLKAHHLEPMVRHQPVPGTDKSPHTTSWASIAPETLAGAKAMLERCASGPGKTERQTYIDSMTVSVTEEMGTVTAPRGTFGVFG